MRGQERNLRSELTIYSCRVTRCGLATVPRTQGCRASHWLPDLRFTNCKGEGHAAWVRWAASVLVKRSGPGPGTRLGLAAPFASHGGPGQQQGRRTMRAGGWHRAPRAGRGRDNLERGGPAD